MVPRWQAVGVLSGFSVGDSSLAFVALPAPSAVLLAPPCQPDSPSLPSQGFGLWTKPSCAAPAGVAVLMGCLVALLVLDAAFAGGGCRSARYRRTALGRLPLKHACCRAAGTL